jgi:hypothetical protein
MYDLDVPADLRLPDADEPDAGPRRPEQADLATV